MMDVHPRMQSMTCTPKPAASPAEVVDQGGSIAAYEDCAQVKISVENAQWKAPETAGAFHCCWFQARRTALR